MAKLLTTPAPSSSVARMFDVTAAAAAISSPEPRATPAVRSVPPRLPAATQPASVLIDRQVTLTSETDETLTRCLAAFQSGTQTRMTTSNLVRSLLRAVAPALPAMEYEAQRLGKLKLPGNGPGTQQLREEFERRIADAIAAAMRQGRERP